ncbi:MAG: recombinase family protein [Rhizobiales bacterium]|nr:recombinase family protein [Hyphomicrobiales bacterium]
MPKAYSYVRFSSPEQARGDSLRRQTAKAEEWCAKRGIVLDDTLRDLGISAYRGANRDVGALRSFLEEVERGKVESGSFLIVESLDRLSREAVLDAAARLFDLIRAGVVVVTLSDGQEYSADRLRNDWTPLIVSIAIMARAHEESRVKGERVGEAWAKKRERARAGTHLMTRRTPEWIAIEDGKFVLREDRVDIVRRVFQMTIEGHGRRTIVSRLNQEGVPTFRADENRKVKPTGWQTSSVAKILNSRATFGEFQPGTGSTKYRTHKPDGPPVKDYYPAVIDEKKFDEAQGVIASRRSERDENGVVIRRGKGGRRGYGLAHLLIGLGRCDRCHGPMHIINKGKPPKGALYFECSTARRKAGCDNANRWRVDDIERRLLKHLSYIDADAVLEGAAPSGDAQRVAGLRARLADAERQRDAILRVVATGDEAAVAMFDRLAGEVKEAAAELAKAEAVLARAVADPGLKARLAEAVDLNRAMGEAEGEERTAIRTRLAEQLRQLVEAVNFHPEIGVSAKLNPRPDVPADRVPYTYGYGGRWTLALDWDSEPHGPDLMEDIAEVAESYSSKTVPAFARKAIESGGGAS